MTSQDYELGLRLRDHYIRSGISVQHHRSASSLISDILEKETSLLAPLRDLISKPGFSGLLHSSTPASKKIAKANIIRDLKNTYNPAIIARINQVIDGIQATTYTKEDQGLTNKPSQQRPHPASIALRGNHPYTDAATQPNRNRILVNSTTATAGLIGIISGCFLLGLLTGLRLPLVNTKSSESKSRATLEQEAEKITNIQMCGYQENPTSKLEQYSCAISHFKTSNGATGTKVTWGDGEISRYTIKQNGSFQSWYKQRPDRGTYTISSNPILGERMLRLEATLDNDITWLPISSLPGR